MAHSRRKTYLRKRALQLAADSVVAILVVLACALLAYDLYTTAQLLYRTFFCHD